MYRETLRRQRHHVTGGRENGILGCDLYSLGRRATEVIGGDRKTLTPGKHFVENCWMTRSAASITPTCRPCNSKAWQSRRP